MVAAMSLQRGDGKGFLSEEVTVWREGHCTALLCNVPTLYTKTDANKHCKAVSLSLSVLAGHGDLSLVATLSW